MITKEQRQEIVTKYGKNPQDTGSAAVQIALLTARILDLDKHFQRNRTESGNVKDAHSYRGLEKIINQRKSLQKYYKRKVCPTRTQLYHRKILRRNRRNTKRS